MAIHKLTPRKVASAASGKYEDGGGLRLVVSGAGARKWVLRFSINGKRREMGLGSYPDVELADARAKASVGRQQAAEGIDPIEARRVEPEAIATEDILAILTPIWTTKTETAKRIQGRIENILDFAAAHKYRDAQNPARWRGHLDMLLPKPSRVKTVTHHPAMPYTDVPALMNELLDNGSTSALALRMLILTTTRTSEVLQAQWSEIDLEAAVWTISATRMKTRREHRVPLSDAVMIDLSSLPRIDGNPYLFPGARYGKPLSNMALLQLMRGMGYGINGVRGNFVPHGFRSSFRDWSGEVSSFPRDVAEMALAHVIENKVEGAYRRGDLFEKRTKMMKAWSGYLTSELADRKVVWLGQTD